MRYIKSYTNDAAIQAAVDDKSLGKPYVALDENTGKIDWNGKEETPDYASMYLTIEALEDGQIRSNSQAVNFSVNNGEWFTTNNYVTLAKGDNVRLKSSNFCSLYAGLLMSNMSLPCNIYGNIMSLGYNDNFQGQSQLPDYAYKCLFDSWSGIVSAKNLILPANSLTKGCYSDMFHGCSSLNYIKCLATDISAVDCTNTWLDGVSSTGTFVKKAGVNWPTGKNGIPKGWTVVEE